MFRPLYIAAVTGRACPVGGASVGMEPVAREKEERTNADTTELYKVFPGLFVRQGTCLAGMCLVLSAGPPHLLLQVVATHPYTGEDEDELTFEKGEIVSVIPYEDSEDEVSILVQLCLAFL